MKSRTAKIVAGAALAAVMMVTSYAGADTRSIEDGRDPEQKVDPVAATHGHHESFSRILVHSIEMAEAWADGDLFGFEVRVWLPDGDRAMDRLVGIGFNPDRSMYARIDDERGRTIGYGNVWMEDEQTVRLEFSRSSLGNVASYRWALIASFACEPPAGGECMPQRDRVPDKGRVRHRL